MLSEIKTTTMFSREIHFLCQSGDQIILKDMVCDKKEDCDDASDEIGCDTCEYL